MNYGKQTNLNVSNVHDDEKTIATAVNVMFLNPFINTVSLRKSLITDYCPKPQNSDFISDANIKVLLNTP